MAKINRTWEKCSPEHQWTTFWMETLNKAFVHVPKYQKIPKKIGTEGALEGYHSSQTIICIVVIYHCYMQQSVTASCIHITEQHATMQDNATIKHTRTNCSG